MILLAVFTQLEPPAPLSYSRIQGVTAQRVGRNKNKRLGDRDSGQQRRKRPGAGTPKALVC